MYVYGCVVVYEYVWVCVSVGEWCVCMCMGIWWVCMSECVCVCGVCVCVSVEGVVCVHVYGCLVGIYECVFVSMRVWDAGGVVCECMCMGVCDCF